jgi:hypothetical protein
MLVFLHEHNICHLDWNGNMFMDVLIPDEKEFSAALAGTHGHQRRYVLIDFGEAVFYDEDGKYYGTNLITFDWARREDVRQLAAALRPRLLEVRLLSVQYR